MLSPGTPTQPALTRPILAPHHAAWRHRSRPHGQKVALMPEIRLSANYNIETDGQ
jgi:hypothetical protein